MMVIVVTFLDVDARGDQSPVAGVAVFADELALMRYYEAEWAEAVKHDEEHEGWVAEERAKLTAWHAAKYDRNPSEPFVFGDDVICYAEVES